jgi:HlyD family secretion protein
MSENQSGVIWKWWAACGGVVMVAILLAGYFLFRDFTSQATAHESKGSAEHAAPIRVEVTTPKKGEMDRTTVQPGTLQSYETVQLFSRVQGFLGEESVDIGDRVKKGQVLARIAVPELDKQVQRNKAALDQAKAKVAQMDARLVSAKADRDAVKAFVKQSEASAKSAMAWLRFRDKQLNRMKELFALKSIDERLVDEMQERFEAATESQNAAVATVETANAKVAAAEAKIKEVEADVIAAKAEVEVAKWELEKSEVLVGFATITAPSFAPRKGPALPC